MNKQQILNCYQNLASDLAGLIGPVRFSSEINLKLERIAHLLELSGNPHHDFPAIHVGGTSGKGSTVTMITTILEHAGYKVGSYLSPHLQILNERFQINNKMVATTQLAEIFESIKPAIQTVAQENPFGQPSNFEVQVAMAFTLFSQEKVDVAVVEVGLGGSLDATNVLPAKIAVLTNVGLDHTEILGDTVEIIANDKAGIIKTGQIVISGLTQPATQQIVAERCARIGATLWQLGEHFQINDQGNIHLSSPERSLEHISPQMRGNFQLANAACAIAACHAFSPQIANHAYYAGLEQAVISGRMEIIQEKPIVILDGAHNPDKMRAAVQAVQQEFPDKKRTVVFALKSGKDAGEILSSLVKDTATLIITGFKNELWDACAPQLLAQIARQLAPDLEIILQPDPIQAVRQALSISEVDDLVLITGSLYLIGNVRDYWVPNDALILQAEENLG